MDKYLDEDMVYYSQDEINKAFSTYARNSVKKNIDRIFRELKYFQNGDFHFIDVYNQKLFLKNFRILLPLVKSLQGIGFTKRVDTNILGDFFETYMQDYPQHEGAFFTPLPLVNFIVQSIPAFKDARVIDFACGVGHFLTQYVELNNTLKDSTKFLGIEKDDRLAKAAKVASFMHQSEVKIHVEDSLDEEILSAEKLGKFTHIISNPPYSVKGFLSTLHKSSLKEYELYRYKEHELDTLDSIECFFIERASQLLDSNGILALILPNTILNKGGIFTKTREILLRDFRIIALVELGNSAFFKTGTNTVILFALRKDRVPTTQAEKFNDFYEKLINNQFTEAQDTYRDFTEFFNAYCEFREIDKESLCNLFSGKEGNLEQRLDDELRAYKQALQKAKSEYDKKSQRYKENNEFIAQSFEDFLRPKEAEKFLYFCHCYNQEILIIKSPQDKDKQKKFLGYEWSTRKGQEGMRVQGSADNLLKDLQTALYNPSDKYDPTKLNVAILNAFYEASTNSGAAGEFGAVAGDAVERNENSTGEDAEEKGTVVLGESGLTAGKENAGSKGNSGATKENGSFKNSHKTLKSEGILEFAELDLSHENFSYLSRARLLDLLDFEKSEFNKAINLNPAQTGTNSQNPFENSKYELVKLREACDLFNGYAFKKTDYVEKSNTLLIRMGNIRPNATFDPEHKIAYLPDDFAEKYKNYLLNENDVIIAMTSAGSSMNALGIPALVNNLRGRNFLLNQRVGKLFNIDFNRINIFYLKIILATPEAKKQFEKFGYGSIQINLGKNNILSVKIPLPPLEIQKQIVEECEKVETQYQTIRMSIEKYQELIKAILAKSGVIDSKDILDLFNVRDVSLNAQHDGGGSNNTSSSLDSIIKTLIKNIESLEKAIDYDLLFKSLQVRESKDVSLNAQHDVGGLENRKTPLNLNTLLDSIPTPSKEDFEIFKLSDSEKFSLSIGKRVLNSELNPNATIPVYSANVKIPFGYIDKECLKDYESDSVLWGIDGDWMVGFMPRGRAFYPTDHCGILRVKDDSVNARILSFGLESEGKKAGFRREYRASLDRVADLKIPLPPLQVQQILVNLIEKLESKIEILQFSLSTLELKKHEILKKYL